MRLPGSSPTASTFSRSRSNPSWRQPRQRRLEPEVTVKSFAMSRSAQRVAGDRNAERRFAHRIDGRVLDRGAQRQVRLGDVKHRQLDALLDVADARRTTIGIEGGDDIGEGR